jgi:hypothetical protein
MALFSNPTAEPMNTPPNMKGEKEEGHHCCLADPAYNSPPHLLNALPSADVSSKVGWEDDTDVEKEEDIGGEADTGDPDTSPRWWPSKSARRDPRKAELFRRLDAACEARRLEEARLHKT